MTTVSDAFPAVNPTVGGSETPETVPQRAGAHARMRARDYRSLPVVGKALGIIGRFAVVAWSDLQQAWWTPPSLPPLRQAWERRMPDRDRVPGGSKPLYWGWAAWNHSIGLLMPAVAVAVVGVMTVSVWVLRHPARAALAAVIAAPLILPIFTS